MTSPQNWTDSRLGELCTLHGGSAFSRSLQGREKGDIPFIKQSDMSLAANSLYIFESNNWVSDADLLELRAHLLPPMSVVFGKIGEGLKRNRYRVLTRPTLIDNNMMGAVPNSLVDQRFFAIVMSQIDMGSLAEGSALPYLRAEDVGNVRVLLPPLDEQRAIAGVLGALDDKIESNRRLTATIDGLLRAELENAILNDDNPREVRFGEIALRVGEASDPRNLQKHVPYIGLEHMPRGNMFLDEWGSSEGLGSGKSVFKEGNVLFGRLRPYFKKVGVAPIDGICSTDVLVLRPAFNESAAMLLAIAASEEFIGYASAAATGTKMPRVSWDYLSDWKTVLPSEAATNRFDIDMSPLVAKAIDSVHERIALAQLRDALLPELLSGRLRVQDAEPMMENM